MIGSQNDVYKYAVLNYWNRFFDSTKVFPHDTAFVGGVSKRDFNAAYNEYVKLLFSTSTQNAYKAQKTFIKRALQIEKEDPTANVLSSVISISEYVLYGVNSDYRSEEFYLPIAETLSTSELIDSLSRTRYAKEARNCSLNRLGTVATDFSFCTSKSQISSLHKIKADYILLFFSNPGCTACKEIIDEMKNSLKIEMLQERGILKVLNMYIDEDLTEWFKYMPIYPDNWSNAYDHSGSIRKQNLYDVRAIPSLFLLDKEKRVIFKDSPFYLILNYLENL